MKYKTIISLVIAAALTAVISGCSTFGGGTLKVSRNRTITNPDTGEVETSSIKIQSPKAK